jgi:hypothetical protein
MKIRKCIICKDTDLLVPPHELKQFCRGLKVCTNAGVMRLERILPNRLQFIRRLQHPTDSSLPDIIEYIPLLAESVITNSPLQQDEFFDAEEELFGAQTEEIPREIAEEDEEWEIEAVCGCRQFDGAQNHLVKWRGHSKRTWTNITYMTSGVYSLITYWRSTAGVRRLRELSRGAECAEQFNYDDWVAQVKTGIPSEAHSIWYVAAIQLASVPHPTHNALKTQLNQKHCFTDDTLFEVWVIPRLFYSEDATVLLPLVDVKYSVLNRLFRQGTWPAFQKQIVNHVRQLAMDVPVPLLWLHTHERDEVASIYRNNQVDAKEMAEILNAGH